MSFQELLAMRGKKLGGKYDPIPETEDGQGGGEGDHYHQHHHYPCHHHYIFNQYQYQSSTFLSSSSGNQERGDEGSNGGGFVCEKCKFETSEKGKMKEHNREKHRIFECKHCDQKSSSKVGLMMHSKKSHAKEVEDMNIEESTGKRKFLFNCEQIDQRAQWKQNHKHCWVYGGPE